MKYWKVWVVCLLIMTFGCEDWVEEVKEAERKEKERKAEITQKQTQIDEWVKLRSNEDKYKGRIVTWEFKVSYFTKECPLGYLDRLEHGVVIFPPKGYYTYQAAMMLGDVPTVKEDDWIRVTGKFKYISSDGVIVLQAISVKNLGYKKK